MYAILFHCHVCFRRALWGTSACRKIFFPTGEPWGCRVTQRNELFVFIKAVYLFYSHFPKMQEFKFVN